MIFGVSGFGLGIGTFLGTFLYISSIFCLDFRIDWTMFGLLAALLV